MHRLPLCYHRNYNITFWGLEKCHPFDSCKYARCLQYLVEDGILPSDDPVWYHQPENPISTKALLTVHTKEYLDSLNSSCNLARLIEVPFVCCIPSCVLHRRVLRPFRLQSEGTCLASRLACEHGWAINLGGGFHHASGDEGGGFCVYADISIAVRMLLEEGLAKRVMIVDLDVHQGNGHERDLVFGRMIPERRDAEENVSSSRRPLNRAERLTRRDQRRAFSPEVSLTPAMDTHSSLEEGDSSSSSSSSSGTGEENGADEGPQVYIFDAFNAQIYPNDVVAMEGIAHSMGYRLGCTTRQFLRRLKADFTASVEAFDPDFILYNAGTDILEGDPLGGVNISEEGVIERDRFVFETAFSRGINICMVLSGGYQRRTSRVIATSIRNLFESFPDKMQRLDHPEQEGKE